MVVEVVEGRRRKKREALELLCRCIRSLTDVKLDPQDLISAKDDIVDEQVKCKLQDTLSILSDYAVRLKGYSVNAMNDNYLGYKLKFAVLQYPALDFYFPRVDGGTRILLIALSWLLATEDVLTLVHRMKLIKNKTQTDNLGEVLETKSREPLAISAEFDKISQLNGKVNTNLKEISELKREWSRLASKISESVRDSVDETRSVSG
ncbi:PREDICTED: uncharacterized protein LOC106750254 isoform X2 [Dinoponera quadriceps]|uniref:Uncharacterized protein LOC106750254 isoform X2 n=1 Tax=Dinoponera quadriceps TaxID=609295 RepID=A0A6P3Y4Z6_DINQU|nr:PREDICTED: uncharacterized protein LOC106750254 isoform X2 [Dinoponera quadriceps]